ncbi:MAG: alanine racemase [Saprospiraceae bacterium]|nr:alanine racemase [Saprospiraceae bacterium]
MKATSIIPDPDYFSRLDALLKAHHRAIPAMVVDLELLDQNIQRLQSLIHPSSDFRLVVKSLPSWELMSYVMERLATRKVMVFHQPFLLDLAGKLDAEADVLLGKPLPIKAAHDFYALVETRAAAFDPFAQIQWLIDTTTRLRQYVDLAKSWGRRLRINLELDVGLHRGGFATREELRQALHLLQTHADAVEFSGFMGYDPHVVKLPKVIRSVERARQLSDRHYRLCQALVREEFPALWHAELTFNGAGSPTLALHATAESPLNDVSAGSCLVKPTTFDTPLLADFLPACWIATPVLKKFEGTHVPGLERFRGLLRRLRSRFAQTYIIYGGFWKADYCHPEGLATHAFFGSSTNQNMLHAPAHVSLEVDDYVFLRPHQSEFVFLQFGALLAFRRAELVGRWPVLSEE